MAEIKVEKKSSMAWLWILLALILAALLLWWLLDDDGPKQAAAPIPAAEAPLEPLATDSGNGTAGLAGGPVTDLFMLTGPDATALAGREVRLEGVPVAEMVSDAGFWIGSGRDRVFVALNEQPTPNTSTEGRVDIDAGQTISLLGTVKTSAEAVPAGVKIPAGVERYIWASSAEVAAAR